MGGATHSLGVEGHLVNEGLLVDLIELLLIKVVEKLGYVFWSTAEVHSIQAYNELFLCNPAVQLSVKHFEELVITQIVLVFDLVHSLHSVGKEWVDKALLNERNINLNLGHEVNEVANRALELSMVVLAQIFKDLQSFLLGKDDLQLLQSLDDDVSSDQLERIEFQISKEDLLKCSVLHLNARLHLIVDLVSLLPHQYIIALEPVFPDLPVQISRLVLTLEQLQLTQILELIQAQSASALPVNELEDLEQIFAVDRDPHSFIHFLEVIEDHVALLSRVVNLEEIVNRSEVAVHLF
jgi:hypothetical protein